MLARAVEEELRTWPQRRDETGFAQPQDQVLRVLGRYQTAMRHPAVAAEARVRLGYFELRRGRLAEALALFEAAGVPDDPMVRYTRHLFRGEALGRAGRMDDSAAAYADAFAVVPWAQSATLGWAAALSRAGRQEEAATLVNRLLLVDPAPLDPWTRYLVPDWRFWDDLMTRLKRGTS